MTGTPEACAFCELGDEVQARLIRVGQGFISLLSNPRITPGHALVIPKRHIENPVDISLKESLTILSEIKRLQFSVLDRVAPGVDVWQKYEPYALEGHRGTNMHHVHFHVIPRRPDDHLFMTPDALPDTFLPLSEEERERYVDTYLDE